MSPTASRTRNTGIPPTVGGHAEAPPVPPRARGRIGPGAGTAAAKSKTTPKAKPTYYLSLGDSLAAGYYKDAAGVTRYSATDYTHRLYGAARKTSKRLQLVSYGCPGESTTTMQADRGCPLPRSAADDRAQLERAVSFLKAHKGRVKYVTLSIGANNFTRCTPGGTVDFACVADGLNKLKQDLPTIDKALRKAAGAKTRIADLLLYDPYLSYWLNGPQGQALARQADALVKTVNDAIRTAGKPYGFAFADGYSAFDAGDFATASTYNGQAVPLNVARACTLSQNCLPAPQGNIHPTAAGYKALFEAFRKALKL